MGVKIDASKALKDVTKRLTALQRTQVPFATASALTTLAKMAQAGEKEALPSIFDRPTPFTVNAVAIKPATKSKLTAVVFYKDIAAQYLAPFEDGGTHFLGGKQALLTPVGQKVNQYGNLPRGKIAQLVGKPNVFVGAITFKASGKTVSGVWQRSVDPRGKRRGEDQKSQTGKYGTKGKHSIVAGARTTLKLLVQFDDPQPVTQHLGFENRVVKTVAKNLHPVFASSMQKAVDSAR